MSISLIMISGNGKSGIFMSCPRYFIYFPGFGHDLAITLESLGCVVYAGCLLPEGRGANYLRKSKSGRMHVINLDITNDSHVSDAFEYVTQTSGTKGEFYLVHVARNPDFVACE